MLQKAFLQSRSISLVDMYIDNSEPSENVGQIHFSLEYDFQNSTLILRIIQVGISKLSLYTTRCARTCLSETYSSAVYFAIEPVCTRRLHTIGILLRSRKYKANNNNNSETQRGREDNIMRRISIALVHKV